MMRPANDLDTVWLARDPVDFRKGINGLSILVEDQLSSDPFSGQLFVFTNKKRDKVKILYWERSGFCLWQKQLEKEHFKWPEHLTGAPPPANQVNSADPARGSCGTTGASGTSTIVLDGQQLNWLLDGYDLAAMRPHRSLCYRTVL
ncbi:MAG: IS66 family insertion sequence element accessory protein TnpB [Albidovulum sp.]|uniref:IS66 family insertion sequence element accessory protein TnpB n=1 Tax=Albidovulum sp. TaxID=1872424 RepID=UPI003C96FC80